MIFVLNLENERDDYQDWMQTNTVKYPSSLVGYCGLFGVRHEKSVLTSPKEEHETRRGIGVWIADSGGRCFVHPVPLIITRKIFCKFEKKKKNKRRRRKKYRGKGGF